MRRRVSYLHISLLVGLLTCVGAGGSGGGAGGGGGGGGSLLLLLQLALELQDQLVSLGQQAG